MFLLAWLLPLLALLVLGSRNPVHSVLFLVLTFINGAALLILLGAEFLALLFVVVYVGAVAVLFLFIVMMLNLKIEGFRQSLLTHYPLSLLALVVFFLFLFLSTGWLEDSLSFSQGWEVLLQTKENLPVLGFYLYNYAVFPLLLASLLLLVAMLGSILLTFLPSDQAVNRQIVYQQVVRSSVVRLF